MHGRAPTKGAHPPVVPAPSPVAESSLLRLIVDKADLRWLVCFRGQL